MFYSIKLFPYELQVYKYIFFLNSILYYILYDFIVSLERSKGQLDTKHKQLTSYSLKLNNTASLSLHHVHKSQCHLWKLDGRYIDKVSGLKVTEMNLLGA